MNKITRETFARLTDQLLGLTIASEGMLVKMLEIVFNKALEDVFFQNMYAELFRALGAKAAVWSEGYLRVAYLGGGSRSGDDSSSSALAAPPPGTPGWYYDVSGGGGAWRGPYTAEVDARSEGLRATSFKRLLLNRCQQEFVRDEAGDVYAAINDEETADAARRAAAAAPGAPVLTPEEDRALRERALLREEKRAKIKRRMLANISFIGHLYLIEGMLSAAVMNECVKKLLRGAEGPRPDEEQVEALCKLLGMIGKKLEAEEQGLPEKLRQCPATFKTVAKLMDHPALPARMGYLCLNLLEARNAWRTELGLPIQPIVRAVPRAGGALLDGAGGGSSGGSSGGAASSGSPAKGRTPAKGTDGVVAAAAAGAAAAASSGPSLSSPAGAGAAGPPTPSGAAGGAPALASPGGAPSPAGPPSAASTPRGPSTLGPKSGLYRRPGGAATPTGSAPSPGAGAPKPQ
jgi:hypothetical protein